MENLILVLFIVIILLLNIVIYQLFKRGKMNLIVSGFIMMILAPVFGFSSGALFLHLYDWSSGGTGEGAGYGGAFIGLITMANGILVFIIGIIKWIFSIFRKEI